MVLKLGQIVATPAALELLEENGINGWDLLSRHINGDWGDLCEGDKEENRLALQHGYRIMSSYPLNTNGDKLWIITEADRSSTCLLLPDDY